MNRQVDVQGADYNSPKPILGPLNRNAILSWIGGTVAIGLLSWLTHTTDSLMIMAPFGATAVLAFGVHESPLAQPRNIIGGHFLAALVGLIFLTFFGNEWWVIGPAVGTGITVMILTKTTHPPAGANPIVVMMLQPTWDFLLTPVLAGAVLMVVSAWGMNKPGFKRNYPVKWF